MNPTKALSRRRSDRIPYGKPKNDSYSIGMEMREYYAAKAMQALIAIHPDQPMDFIAKRAFEHADAMVAASGVEWRL